MLAEADRHPRGSPAARPAAVDRDARQSGRRHRYR